MKPSYTTMIWKSVHVVMAPGFSMAEIQDQNASRKGHGHVVIGLLIKDGMLMTIFRMAK